MTAFNIVRFRVRPGRERDFVRKHEEIDADFRGWRGAHLVDTGERTYCFVGEWDSFDDIVAARGQMVAILDGFRDMLEDLGGDLGLTDPVSGSAVVEMRPGQS